MKSFATYAFAAALFVTPGASFAAPAQSASSLHMGARSMVVTQGYGRDRDHSKRSRDDASPACYWLRPHGGWKAMPQYPTRHACYVQDSCDGGLGQSGGGCYKWATGPDAPREDWHNDDDARGQLFDDQKDEFGDDGDVYPDGNDGYGHQSGDNDRGQRKNHHRSVSAACYWLRPQGGWQAMPQYGSKHACFKQDSCDGGQGRSGGGCYKWADGPNAPRHNW